MYKVEFRIRRLILNSNLLDSTTFRKIDRPSVYNSFITLSCREVKLIYTKINLILSDTGTFSTKKQGIAQEEDENGQKDEERL